MATRYFKTKDEHTIVSTSTGNRSKAIPAMPYESWKWIEIERKEFYRLKRRVMKSSPSPCPLPVGEGKGGG